MQKFSVAIVGGGASGIVAAISAKRRGVSVVICEKSAQIGRKLLASGNGRCNLSNEKIDASYYNPSSRLLVKSILNAFGKNEIRNFFNNIGLEMVSCDGRIFPSANQSSSILKVLEMELRRLSVPIELNFDVTAIFRLKNGFTLSSKAHKKIEADYIILTGGGKSYPAFGSDGSAYDLAAGFGHKIVEPVPSAVPIVIKDHICHFLQGQRIATCVKSIINGKVANSASGEMLITKYGLSGASILDISEDISIAVNRDDKADAAVSIDMIPFMNNNKLSNEISKRISKGIIAEELIAGILPNKFGKAFKNILSTMDPGRIASSLKDVRFKVLGTRGWNEAEFTAGGVDVRDVQECTLESRLTKGLYFAGEVLDVNGKRGGYNLAWAWASGFVAGLIE